MARSEYDVNIAATDAGTAPTGNYGGKANLSLNLNRSKSTSNRTVKMCLSGTV